MTRLTRTYFTGLLLIPLFISVTAADENPMSAAEQFADANKEFQQIDAEIRQVIEEFRDASPDRQDELRKQFEELAHRGRNLLPKLRKVGLAAFKEAPNKDNEVNQVLLQVAASDIQSDRYESAKEVTSLLLEHDVEAAGLNELAGVAAYATHDFDAAEKLFEKAKEAGSLSQNGQGYLAKIDTTQENWKVEKALRAKEAKADDLPRVKLETSKGEILLELFENQAPQAVANFISLVEKKFYHGLTFHRVLPGFMAQGGCPNGTGTGGPGYNIYCECYKEGIRKHFAGSLSMAHAGKDTGGSQFFITFRPTPHLDGRHTVFGRVIEGLDVLAKLERIDPDRGGGKPDKILKATVVRKRAHEYKPTKVE